MFFTSIDTLRQATCQKRKLLSIYSLLLINLSPNRRVKHKAPSGRVVDKPIAGGIIVVILETIHQDGIAKAILYRQLSVDSVSCPERESEIIRPANDDHAITSSKCLAQLLLSNSLVL